MSFIDIRDIHSLTDFQRNAKKYARKMNRTGQPLILTVNGKAKFVVQDAEAYQELLKKIDESGEMAAIQQGLAQSQRGECSSADDVFKRLNKKYGISRSTDQAGRSRHRRGA